MLRDTLGYSIHDMMMHLMHAHNLTHGHFSRRFFPAFGEFFALKIEYIMLYRIAVCSKTVMKQNRVNEETACISIISITFNFHEQSKKLISCHKSKQYDDLHYDENTKNN